VAIAALTGGVTATTTTINVTVFRRLPAGAFTVQVGSEQIRVTAIAGTTWTVTRGYDGTTAAAQAANADRQFGGNPQSDGRHCRGLWRAEHHGRVVCRLPRFVFGVPFTPFRDSDRRRNNSTSPPLPARRGTQITFFSFVSRRSIAW